MKIISKLLISTFLASCAIADGHVDKVKEHDKVKSNMKMQEIEMPKSVDNSRNSKLNKKNKMLKITGSKPDAKSVIIDTNGEKVGVATYTQGTEGVVVNISVKNMEPGKHGMHFHSVGDCSDNKDGFKKSGGHIMPSGKAHGYLNENGPHEGNLPNLVVGKNGKAHTEIHSHMVSVNGENGKPALLDKDGSTLIIHKNEDDHKTQPIGNSGDRIACGKVEATKKKK